MDLSALDFGSLLSVFHPPFRSLLLYNIFLLQLSDQNDPSTKNAFSTHGFSPFSINIPVNRTSSPVSAYRQESSVISSSVKMTVLYPHLDFAMSVSISRIISGRSVNISACSEIVSGCSVSTSASFWKLSLAVLSVSLLLVQSGSTPVHELFSLLLSRQN